MKTIKKVLLLVAVIMVVHAGSAFALNTPETGVLLANESSRTGAPIKFGPPLIDWVRLNSENLGKISEHLDFITMVSSPERILSNLRSIEKLLRTCRFEAANEQAEKLLHEVEKAKVTAVQETNVNAIIPEIMTPLSKAFLDLFNKANSEGEAKGAMNGDNLF